MNYKLQEKSVPQQDGTRAMKWYAKEVSMGRSTLEMICGSIAEATTITEVDARAVIFQLVKEIRSRLQAGQIVELGELGNMQLTINNNAGALTKADWTPSLIKKAKVTYRPGTRVKRIAEDATFTRWNGDMD